MARVIRIRLGWIPRDRREYQYESADVTALVDFAENVARRTADRIGGWEKVTVTVDADRTPSWAGCDYYIITTGKISPPIYAAALRFARGEIAEYATNNHRLMVDLRVTLLVETL